MSTNSNDNRMPPVKSPGPVANPSTPVARPATPGAVPTAVPVARPAAAPADNALPRPIPIAPAERQAPVFPQTSTPSPAAQPAAVPVARAVPVQHAPQAVPVAGQVAAMPSPRPVLAKAVPAQAVQQGDPEDEPLEEPTDVAMRAAPPWLISLAVHVVGLVILGLIVFRAQSEKKLIVELNYAERIGKQLDDDLLEMAQSEPLTLVDPVLSMDDIPVEDPFATPPKLELTTEKAIVATSDLVSPSIGLALSGREKGMKKALLDAYGGNATTEAAVGRGLEWLKRNQEKSGLWSLIGPYGNGGIQENRMAATAMALLAFQGAGNTHLEGKYKDVVKRGWKALLKYQDKDGNFFQAGGYHHRFYTQAQCTIALCELYGMTKDSQYLHPAQKSLDYAFNTQDAAGGWRYYVKDGTDTSVTGWFVMALQSGKMAGLNVDSKALAKISQYLDAATTDGGSQYAYQPGQSPKISMTAEGLLCRQYLGWKQNDERLVRGANIVAANPINWDDKDVYYWYYATQTMHHMDGDLWHNWNKIMRDVLPRTQVMTGKEGGSWSPVDDAWQTHGGRLYTTCLCIYMLEVYYRHLPIYRYQLGK